ncbi:MAG TPA: DUF4352 domain-containing protein [Ktedonobacterales bacterium]
MNEPPRSLWPHPPEEARGYPRVVSPPPTPKNRAEWPRVVGWLVFIFIVLFVLAKVVSPAQLDQMANALRYYGTPSPTPAPARVGATITASGVSCTLLLAKPLAADANTTPKSGDVFILARVTITNRSGSEYHYSPFDFHVETSVGNIADTLDYAPTTYAANDLLDNGALANGGTVTGDLTFEVPAHDHGIRITWSPWRDSDETSLAWNVGR